MDCSAKLSLQALAIKSRQSSPLNPGPDSQTASTGADELSAPGGRLPVLDGIRGLAILLVMLHHFTKGYVLEDWIGKFLLRLTESAWCGVDLFFVLSGFLITGILFDAKESRSYFRSFYMRRILRIFPLYYGVLALMFLVVPLFKSFSPSMQLAAQQQGWLWAFGTNIAMAVQGSWIYHADWLNLGHFWTLAVEEHFYLIWPAVVLLLGREALMKTCVGCAVAALALRVVLTATSANYILIEVLTPCRMDALAIGAFVALAARGPGGLTALTRPSRWLAATSAVLLGLLFIGRGSLSDEDFLVQTIGFTFLDLFFAAILVLVVTSPKSLLGRFFSHPALRFLGVFSYAIYVLHLPLQPVCNKLIWLSGKTAFFYSGFAGAVSYVLLASTVSILAGVLSWHCFEKHFLRLKKFFTYAPTQRGIRSPWIRILLFAKRSAH